MRGFFAGVLALCIAAVLFLTHIGNAPTERSTTVANAEATSLTVVYWSASDCPPCASWEGNRSSSGGEAGFLATPEGKAVRYVVVKKARLSNPYVADDFSADQKWLWDRMQSSKKEGEGRIRGFPSFSLFEGDTLVAYARGELGVQTTLIPAIRKRI